MIEPPLGAVRLHIDLVIILPHDLWDVWLGVYSVVMNAINFYSQVFPPTAADVLVGISKAVTSQLTSSFYFPAIDS